MIIRYTDFTGIQRERRLSNVIDQALEGNPYESDRPEREIVRIRETLSNLIEFFIESGLIKPGGLDEIIHIPGEVSWPNSGKGHGKDTAKQEGKTGKKGI